MSLAMLYKFLWPRKDEGIGDSCITVEDSDEGSGLHLVREDEGIGDHLIDDLNGKRERGVMGNAKAPCSKKPRMDMKSPTTDGTTQCTFPED